MDLLLLKINELDDFQRNVAVGVLVFIFGLCIEGGFKGLKHIIASLRGLCRGKNHRIIKCRIFERTSTKVGNKRKDLVKKYVYDMALVFVFLIIWLLSLCIIAGFVIIQKNRLGYVITYGLLIGIIVLATIISKLRSRKEIKYYWLGIIDGLLVCFGMLMLDEIDVITINKYMAFFLTILLTVYLNKEIYKNRYVDWFVCVLDFLRYGVLLPVLDYRILNKNDIYGHIIDWWIVVTALEYVYAWCRASENEKILVYLKGEERILCEKVLESTDGRVMCVRGKTQITFVEKNDIRYMLCESMKKSKKRHIKKHICSAIYVMVQKFCTMITGLVKGSGFILNRETKMR